MTDPKKYLEKDFILHADMIDALLDKNTRVLYSEDDGVLLRLGKKGPYLLSVSTADAMKRTARMIEEKLYMAVVRPFKFVPEFMEIKGKAVETMPCYQVAYRKKEPAPEYDVPGIEIKPLTEEHIRFVCDNYEDEEGYIRSRIEYGMLGAFDKDGNCAGFVGFHGEGSMGLLTVLPEYRRMGIGIALEAKNLNRRLSEGRIPYGHVVVGNEKSFGLQKKIGMEISGKMVTWIFNDY